MFTVIYTSEYICQLEKIEIITCVIKLDFSWYVMWSRALFKKNMSLNMRKITYQCFWLIG